LVSRMQLSPHHKNRLTENYGTVCDPGHTRFRRQRAGELLARRWGLPKTDRGASRAAWRDPKPTWRQPQAGVAPNPNPCQLLTRPPHCRFEPFQGLGRSRKRHSPFSLRQARLARPRLRFLTSATNVGCVPVFARCEAKKLRRILNPAWSSGRRQSPKTSARAPREVRANYHQQAPHAVDITCRDSSAAMSRGVQANDFAQWRLDALRPAFWNATARCRVGAWKMAKGRLAAVRRQPARRDGAGD